MPNTANNDAPYVIGEIADPATADYPGYLNGNETGGFDNEDINPIVVNADGSFVAAFAVTAPSYFYNIALTVASNGIANFGTGGGVAREYQFNSPIAAVGSSVVYTLTGRDISNNIISVTLTPSANGVIVVSEAILANFLPGSVQNLKVSGLASGSSLTGHQMVEIAEFFDAAAPTYTAQAIPGLAPGATTVPGNGVITFNHPTGVTEGFVLQNASVWTTGQSVYNIVVITQQPLDLTGVTDPVGLPNFFAGSSYRTAVTVTPVDGLVAVPPTILQQLQSQSGLVVLQVTGAEVGSIPQAQAIVELPVTTITEGLYTQHFDADGNPTGNPVRLDVAANALLQDEDDLNYTVSRSGDGGLVAAWLGNADSNDEADAVYVVKLDDAGNPVGATVALTGLSADAIEAIVGNEGEAALTGLADGSFAVAYSVEAQEIGQTWAGNVFPGGLSISGVGGQLQRVDLTQFTAAGAISATLNGKAADGSSVSVPVTLVNGVFEMTDALRTQFAADSHISLFYSGLTPGTPYSAQVTVRDVLDYDASSTLTTTNVTTTAANNQSIVPDAFIASLLGQTVSYHVNTITAAQTPQYLLSVFSTSPINTTGLTVFTGPLAIPGALANAANSFVNGYFVTTLIVTPDGGTVTVPASVLAQGLGDQVSSLLMISGLQSGTTVDVDMTVRHASHLIVPGVYTQIFDASGASQGPAQQIDDADASLAVGSPMASDADALGITAHADGGFHVSWLAQNTDGSDLDRLITREFDADGLVTDTSINLNGSDIPGVVAAEAAGADTMVAGDLQVVELGGGGFATLVQVDVEPSLTIIVNSVVTAAPLFILAGQGRLESVFVSQAVAAAPGSIHYTLSGADAGGAVISFEVFPVDGRISIPASLVAQFAADAPLAIAVTGLATGSTFNAVAGAVDVWNYSPASPTVSTSGSVTVPDSGFAIVSGYRSGEATQFDVTSITAASGQTASFFLYVITTIPLNMASIGLPPQNTFPGGWISTVPVTPDGSGIVAVPAALLTLTEGLGAAIVLGASNLAVGSTFAADVTSRLPVTTVTEGLFVQLFDSAGVATGEMIRVDDPATQVIGADDNAKASIQSDGAGGFRVVWASDIDGDGEGDALNFRHYDAAGHQIGTTLTVDSIPDRIYDEGEAVTLYTSGIFADPDPGDVLTFSATGLPAGLAIDAATGVITGAATDAGLFTVTVTATDADGLFASSSFEVFIIDDGLVEENLAPTAVSFTNTVASTPENGGSVKVADIVVADDGQGTNVLALSGADAAWFTIVGTELFFNGGGDFETLAAYDVTVSASDPALMAPAVSADFHLAISDVAEAQTFTATIGDDTLNVDPASLDSWTVNADRGNDSIFTGAGVDHIIGGSGDDEIGGGDGGDTLAGGIGADLIGGGNGDDSMLGDADADELHGGDGADNIDGGSGDDIVRGDAGGDTIIGGSGADDIDGGADDDTINGGVGNDTILGSGGADDVLGEIGDDMIGGGDGGDTLNGGGGADTIDGDADNDTIIGEAGDDTLRGGAGADGINGGTGNDDIDGGDGEDIILGGSGLDTIYGGADNDTISGEGSDDDLFGGGGADTIKGDSGNDTIAGDDGADNLQGGSGLDVIEGGADDDTILGDAGNDTLRGGTGGDTIDGGTNDDDIDGEDGGDTLLGGAGADSIDGGEGDDIITGGAGIDQLIGGSGADSFAFLSKGDSRLGLLADHLADFDVLEDRIDLSAIDANTKVLDDQAFLWIATAAFSRVAGQLRYEVINGSAHITGDINGDAKADFEIVLDGVTSLPGTDENFVL